VAVETSDQTVGRADRTMHARGTVKTTAICRDAFIALGFSGPLGPQKPAIDGLAYGL
jgi:hypothetical protein